MKILVVDDNPVNRKLMVEFLDAFGTCTAVAGGLDAVEKFEESMSGAKGYDLVCLDIMIPDVDGHEVLLKIRQIEDNAGIDVKERSKVIMVTSLDDSENIMQAFTKGQCDGYITKPVTREKLHYHLVEMNLVDTE